MGFTGHSTRVVDVHSADEFNTLLKTAARFTRTIHCDYHGGYSPANGTLESTSYVWKKITKLCLVSVWATGNKIKTVTEYVFRLDGSIAYSTPPSVCWRSMKLADKNKTVPDIRNTPYRKLLTDNDGKFMEAAKPLIWFNKAKDNRTDRVWVYDLNSAYAWALTQELPDTRANAKFDCVCPEGYIGFVITREKEMLTVWPGDWCDVAFPAMESPFIKFANRWYKVKKTTTDPEEKAKAKAMLTIPVGYMQRYNPFIRACIVDRCNKFMLSLMDDDTLMANTDAIYCLKPRTDLSIGKELGQFKVEYEGLIRHRGHNYQTIDENGNATQTKYRGVPTNWIPAGFNLLTDPAPTCANVYYYNEAINQVEDKRNGEGKTGAPEGCGKEIKQHRDCAEVCETQSEGTTEEVERDSRRRSDARRRGGTDCTESDSVCDEVFDGARPQDPRQRDYARSDTGNRHG